MQFTISDIKEYIGKRVALVQPQDITNYSTSILNYFLQGMTTILETGEYSPEEVPELRQEYEKTVNYSDGTAIINILNLEDILNIERVSFRYRKETPGILIRLSPEQFELFRRNKYLKPSLNEGYYSIVGNNIEILVNELETDNIIVVNGVRTPVVDDTDRRDWVSDRKYGRAFLMRSIELASQLMRRELGLEG
jgi:hypothetical protein